MRGTNLCDSDLDYYLKTETRLSRRERNEIVSGIDEQLSFIIESVRKKTNSIHVFVDENNKIDIVPLSVSYDYSNSRNDFVKEKKEHVSPLVARYFFKDKPAQGWEIDLEIEKLAKNNRNLLLDDSGLSLFEHFLRMRNITLHEGQKRKAVTKMRLHLNQRFHEVIKKDFRGWLQSHDVTGIASREDYVAKRKGKLNVFDMKS